MKNKAIAAKIRESANLAKSIKRNKKTAQLKPLKKTVQTMNEDLKAAVSLHRVVQKLKKDLKKRKKELEAQVKKLAKSRREVIKTYEKSKKAAPALKTEKKPKKTRKSKPQKLAAEKTMEVKS